MALKGPLRQHGSVRDIKEGGFNLDKPEQVTAPAWLDEQATTEFNTLVNSLIGANVPIKQIDSYAIACCAQCIAFVSDWSHKGQAAETLKDKLDCSKQVGRFQRDSLKWLDLIGATPASRARIGVRNNTSTEGPLAQLLKAKQRSFADGGLIDPGTPHVVGE